jgi:hypothetical protein
MSNIITIERQSYDYRRFKLWQGTGQSQLPFLSGSLYDVQKEATTTVDLPPINWELVLAKDPFSLSYEQFVNLELNEAEDLIKTVYDSCRSLIEKTWKEGYRHAVICGGKIVHKTADVKDLPEELVKKLGKKYDKACFVFSAPDIVEDSAWTPISTSDSYPTLRVYIGEEDSDEKEIVEKTPPIMADLDTGNPFYKIFDGNQFSTLVDSFSPFELRVGEHLGRSYTYYNKRLKICVMDNQGNVNSTVSLIRLVRNWAGCALLQASPNRVGFLGRDILRDLRIRIKLDPLKKVTQILDVS